MKTIEVKTGRVVVQGDVVVDFRGDKGLFVAATRATEEGKSGKVVVSTERGSWDREYYADVFGLRVVA